MNSVASAVSRVLNQHIAVSGRGLLWTSCMATSATLLLCTSSPALADCQAIQDSNCSYGGTGSIGTDAPGPGENGGDGGVGPKWTLDTGSNTVHFVDLPGATPDAVPLSPINIQSAGGDGARGADGHLTGGGNETGGNGGKGGDSGDITATVGPTTSGTTNSNASGITLGSNGGTGGEGGFGALNHDPGVGGAGGNGGHITASLAGNFPDNLNNQAHAVAVWSDGGDGGAGRSWTAGQDPQAPAGGVGGNGGQIDLTLNGTFIGNTGGVSAESMGGNGGKGGDAENVDGAQGGTGGQGGNGSAVNVTVNSGSNMQSFANQDAGLIVKSAGGTGGQGGGGGSGGGAGAGGNAGNVTVTVNGGNIENGAGSGSAGLLVQSLGGNGGDGGLASHFVIGPNGGSGSVGGTAGAVSVTTGNGGGIVTIVSGQKNPYQDDYSLSPGVLAQSIGGGGGAGSDAKGWFAVGGDGGNGVNGNTASVDLAAKITTYGINSDGLAVQSIGGGGGKGGDAQGSGVEVQMVIGGTGGGGGDGSDASAQLRAGSVIETSDVHSSGMLIQSIGGGGGMGGAAYSKSTNAFYGADMSVGGDGGAGGNGGTVGLVDGASATNAGQISTLGADSYGVIGQSIGGGGGIGGASTAESKTYSGGDAPGLSLTMALGGTGGAGGSGGSVTLVNAGLITTSGAGSVGILGQSIGGGGGAGGDASSSSTASGGNMNLSANFTLGGSGGVAGDGGIANITNSGLIVTTGESAAGMLVQSIGGGGGTGGSGDAKSSANGKDISLTMALGSGGNGGSGGDGYAVTATNNASIITLGDSAFGIGAQSIGGAGGTGGGAAASATGDISASLTIGGAGGAGGSAYHVDGNGQETGIVTVNNSKNATIVTFGADSNGIIAQSIGGGGGAGGKAATSLSTKTSTGDGGNGDATGTQNTFQTLASAFAANGLAGLSQYGGMNGAINAVNSLLNLPSSGVKGATVADGDIDSELDSTAQSKGQADDDNESPSIHLQVALGGQGGGGGSGGEVVVNNDGEIATMGHDADAILAQSIGGGGGKGGAATTATSNQNSGSLSVGGNGGGGGYGDDVWVNNTGAIYTKGALAAGIVAESISGGGGIGGASASSISSSSKNSGASDGELSSISMTLGGNGGTTFDAGEVNVLSSGAISTAAHDAIGIIAQSISGGGGIVKTIATDQEGAGGADSANETAYGIQLKFGGANSVGSSGYGSGYVNVTTQIGGSITTQGANSYGILAQSIAGGGGVALGGTPIGSTVEDWFGTGAKTGSVLTGDVSGLYVNVGDNITTSGNGAIGILSQSIGGGGGLAGDTEASATPVDFVHGNTSSQFTGSGGEIGVLVGQGSTVSTSGTNAPALFLQSIGGGGGRITTANGVYMGTAGGTGQGGAINVTVNGTVLATGPGSAGIVAQSEGGNEPNGTPNSSPINITVGSTGKISAGLPTVETSPNMESAAIFIDHGGLDSAHPNTVINNGQIVSYGTLVNSVAIWSSAGYTQVYNNAGANMSGDVLLTNDGGSGCFSTYGTFASGNLVTVGKCPVINGGTINVGSAGVVGKTTISGDYVQLAGGKLDIDADLSGGKADTLVITGNATISGVVNVNAMTVSNKPVTVLTATGGVSLDPHLKQTDNSALFDFPVVASGNQLDIQPTAHFNDAAANLDQNQKKMAAYLQQLFNSGASLDDGFTALSKISLGDVDRDYGASLRSMSGEALGAFGAFRVNSSRAFVDNLYQGCRDLTFERNTNESCSWARISGGSADQSARGDTVGYHASAYTVEVGAQLGLSDKLALVGSLGSEQSQFSGDDIDTSQIKGNAAVLGVGLNYADGPWELAGALDGAYGWYRSYRIITVGEESQSADATPRQWQLGAHVKGGYEVDFASSTYVKPFVEAHVIRVTNNSFTEDGNSPFRLSVDGRSDTSLVAGTGVELGAHIPTRFGAELHPFISAAAEFGQDVQWTSTAHFAEQPTGPGFETQTAGPGTVGRFTVGADLVNLKNLSFSLLYSPEVGSGYHSQQGTARISYTF